MAKFSYPLDAALVAELEDSFFAGPMLNEAGLRSLNEEEVDRIGKMSIQIQSDEHPPPHFHVIFAGEDASFAIADGVRLKNVKGLERFDKNIRKWWKSHRCDLIFAWNRLRPSDCSVGPIDVPPECLPSKI